ncbi:hypothetical protein BOSP111201_01890 [Bordetella sputigena]
MFPRDESALNTFHEVMAMHISSVMSAPSSATPDLPTSRPLQAGEASLTLFAADTFETVQSDSAGWQSSPSHDVHTLSRHRRQTGTEAVVNMDDSLWNVAARLRIPGASICQAAVALWRANPDAFEGNDISRLKEGTTRLVRPADAVVLAIENKEAKHTCSNIKPRDQNARRLQPETVELVFFGDTITRIANRFDVPGATQYQKMVAIFETNGHAFKDGDIKKLKTGVVLTLPSAERVAKVSGRLVADKTLIRG